MVIFALTRGGYDELRSHLKAQPSALWVGRGVLTDGEADELRGSGVMVTAFNRAIVPTDYEAIEGAVHTIAQHHPGQIIWVERKDDVVESGT